MTENSNYINPLLESYKNIGEAIIRYRSKELPIGCPVVVNHPRYSGPGIVVAYPAYIPDQVGVRIENGNVWNYPLASINRTLRKEVPSWVENELRRRSRLNRKLQADLVMLT